MNKLRRQQIADIISQLEELLSKIEDLQYEEQEYFDNMPESFQYGEKGTKAEAAIDEMQNAIDGINDIISNLESASE